MSNQQTNCFTQPPFVAMGYILYPDVAIRGWDKRLGWC